MPKILLESAPGWNRCFKKTVSNFKRIFHERIRQIIKIKEIIVEEVERRQLIWYGWHKKNGGGSINEPPEWRKKGKRRRTLLDLW